jgi:L-asparagine transporter-like permease
MAKSKFPSCFRIFPNYFIRNSELYSESPAKLYRCQFPSVLDNFSRFGYPLKIVQSNLIVWWMGISLYLLSCISHAFSLMFTADFFWFIIWFVYLYCLITFRNKHISHNNFLKTDTLKLQLLCGSKPISEHKHNMVYLYFCRYMYLFYVEFSTYMYICYLYLNR